MQKYEDLDPYTKFAPYGMAFLFVLHFGNHYGVIGTIQEFISLVAVIKFVHYVALRTCKVYEFILAQIMIVVFYFFIFKSFFLINVIFLLIYDVIFAFYIYSYMHSFDNVTLEDAFERFKKALAANGFKK